MKKKIKYIILKNKSYIPMLKVLLHILLRKIQNFLDWVRWQNLMSSFYSQSFSVRLCKNYCWRDKTGKYSISLSAHKKSYLQTLPQTFKPWNPWNQRPSKTSKHYHSYILLILKFAECYFMITYQKFSIRWSK